MSPQAAAPYVLNPAVEVASEASRLDLVNDALVSFFEGQLSCAPIEESNPHRILDLGSGTGAWAISAANSFPKADVVGLDVNLLPRDRDVPPNCQFLQHDILLPFPFQEETFDVIHARMILLHLSGVEDILNRVSQILKPNGILVLEDPDDEQIDSDGVMHGIAGKSPLVSVFHEIMRERKTNPCIGRDHASILDTLGCFSEIHTKKAILPLTRTNDPSIGFSILQLTKVWKENYKVIANSLPALHGERGISPELVAKFIIDIDNPDIDFTSVLYFTWARKKVASPENV